MANGKNNIPSDKRVWQTIEQNPCPFRMNFLYCLQQLLGTYVWDADLQEQVWENVESDPAPTRTVLMWMDKTGFLHNAYADSFYGPSVTEVTVSK